METQRRHEFVRLEKYYESTYRVGSPANILALDTDKQEAEVEGIDGGKVLLVKVQDQVHALNANCTHFGAPLKNGVVTSEGRITCPWHGGMA